MSTTPVRIALPFPSAPKATRARERFAWLAPLSASTVLTVFLLVTARHGWTHWQGILAFCSVATPCFAYAHWRQTRRTQIPLFAVLAAAHTVFYCLGVFWTDQLEQFSSNTGTAVLAWVNLGVFSLLIGMRVGNAGVLVRRIVMPDVPRDVHDWWHVRAVAACQVLVPFLPVGTGGDFRQVVAIVLSFVPMVAFLILWDAVLRGKGTSVDRALVAIFVASSIFAGLVTGWLGGCVGTLVLASIGFVRVRRRVPVMPVAVIALAMVFLQGGKAAFRERFWYGNEEAGPFEKARYWVQMSMERVASFDSTGDVGAPVLTRSSLVTESATVYENTPSLVPYQYGASYGYLFITLIPRFLWPNKPSVNDANRFYQVAFGVTQAEDLDHVAIGAGLIPEAYMNFGWLGIPLVMGAAGILLGIFERVFLGRNAGTFASAVGLAYVVPLLALNGQAAAYLGGMVQMVGLAIVIFLPGLRLKNHSPRLCWRSGGSQ